MSTGAERKARTRELRRQGYRGQISFQIHDDGIDQLIALGLLGESEANDLDRITEVVERLINVGGIERLIICDAEHLPTEDEELLPQPRRPRKAREIPDVPFIY